MKKVLAILFLFFSISTAVSIFQSCELLGFGYDAWICDVEFTTIAPYQTEPERFTDIVGFVVYSTGDYTCRNYFFSPFSSCYATTKCADYKNNFDLQTFELSFDRTFIFASDSIASNTNIFEIQEIESSIETSIDDNTCKGVVAKIIFTEELLKNITFEQGEYEVTFKCSTTDNRNFTKTRTVIFKE